MQNQSPKHANQRPRRSRVKVFFAWAFFLILIVGGASAAYTYAQTKNSLDKTFSAVSQTHKTTITSTKPISILLLGTDTGAFGRTDTGRSDTMIVVTINPKTEKTTMTSIPRDTLAKISATNGSASSTQKINAAYTVGGAGTAMKTVEKLLNIPINYYVTINMGGLRKVVNALGGIDVNVPFSWTDSHTHMSFTKGKAHLNGKQALAFARMRYEDPNGDYGRQKRQQQVIQAIIKKVNAKKSVSLYKKLLKLASNNMRTNLSFNDMIKLATDDQGATKHIKKTTLQGVGAYINEESYQVPTTKELQKVSNQLRSELGLSKETLSNTNTKLNKLNTAAGFDWSGDNPTYTLYTSDTTSTDTTTTDTGGTTETGGYTAGATTGGPGGQQMR